jgi:predicted RNase H-like nuclease (RuvC/YqgF family)
MKKPIEPKKPENEIIEKQEEIEGWTIDKILAFLNSKNIDPNKAYINNNWTGYEDCDLVLSYHERQFTDEEFLIELKKYEERLLDYQDDLREWEDEQKELRQEKLEKLLKEKEELEKKIKQLK